MDLIGFIVFVVVARAIYQLCTWSVADHKADLKYRAGIVKKGGGLVFRFLKSRM